MKVLLCLLLGIVAVCAIDFTSSYPAVEPAFAGGRHIQNSYSTCGVWNSIKFQSGFIVDECCPVDVSFPGNPWQSLCFRYFYPDNHTAEQVFVGNEGQSDYVNNGMPDEFTTPACDWTVNSVELFPPGSGSSFVGVKHEFQVGDMLVTKIESWDFKAKAANIAFTVEFPEDCCDFLTNVTQDGPFALEDVIISFSVDPDPDYANFDDFNTVNWRVFGDWYAESVGPSSCTTLGFGKCVDSSVVGHTPWLNCPLSEWNEIRNEVGITDDLTMAWSHKFDRLECGETRAVNFVVVWGVTPREARDNFVDAFSCYCPFDAATPPNFNDDPEDYWPYMCACNCDYDDPDTYCNCTSTPTLNKKRSVKQATRSLEDPCAESSTSFMCLLQKVRTLVKNKDVAGAERLIEEGLLKDHPRLMSVLKRFLKHD